MYTGLVLLPWVVFFGFSGMLFNHPEWFGPVDVVSTYSADEVAELASFEFPEANRIADEVVRELNRGEISNAYLRNSGKASFNGALTFQSNTESGSATATISPQGARANVKKFQTSAEQTKPEFHGKKIEVSSFNPKEAKELATEMFTEAGLHTVAPVEAGRRGGAEVRFQMESAKNGKKWNVVYDLNSGEVSARDADAALGLDFYSVVSRLHKTHHYPNQKNFRWFWTLIADATGITMVFWGISGAIMWWQLKPTRVLGVAGLSVAGVLAALVFTGTFQEANFGPAKSKGGASAAPSSRSERPEDSSKSKGKPPAGNRPGPGAMNRS